MVLDLTEDCGWVGYAYFEISCMHWGYGSSVGV